MHIFCAFPVKKVSRNLCFVLHDHSPTIIKICSLFFIHDFPLSLKSRIHRHVLFVWARTLRFIACPSTPILTSKFLICMQVRLSWHFNFQRITPTNLQRFDLYPGCSIRIVSSLSNVALSFSPTLHIVLVHRTSRTFNFKLRLLVAYSVYLVLPRLVVSTRSYINSGTFLN